MGNHTCRFADCTAHHFGIYILICMPRHAFQLDRDRCTMVLYIPVHTYTHRRYDGIFHHSYSDTFQNNSSHTDRLGIPIHIDHPYTLWCTCRIHWIDHKCYRAHNYICVNSFGPKSLPYSLNKWLIDQLDCVFDHQNINRISNETYWYHKQVQNSPNHICIGQAQCNRRAYIPCILVCIQFRPYFSHIPLLKPSKKKSKKFRNFRNFRLFWNRMKW